MFRGPSEGMLSYRSACPENLKMVWVFPGFDLLYADRAQPLTTAGEELDYLQIMI